MDIRHCQPFCDTPRRDDAHSQWGMVPNLIRVLGNGAGAPDLYLQSHAALSGGFLSARLRERIALVVAEANQCDYCLNAHSEIARKVGLSEEDIADSRRARASDQKTAAALQFAWDLVVHRGRVDSDAAARLRAEGYRAEAIVEIIANVALNIFTNYFSHVAQAAIDLLEVPKLADA